MKIKSPVLALMVFVIFFGGIALTSALNLWQTESAKVPVKYSSGDAAGEYNPADIRGSYSFGDVHELFDIPLEDLKTAFQIPDDYDIASFQNKQLEEIYESLAEEDSEIGNSSVQLFVAFYKNLPFDLSTDIYLPVQAVEILAERANLSEEQQNYLSTHQVDVSSRKAPVEQQSEPVELRAELPDEEKMEDGVEETLQDTAAPVIEEHDESETMVRGKTTFQEVIDWGVPLATIEELVGTEVSAPNMVIKDFCNENGIEFATLKEALQQEVDQILATQ